MSALHLYLTADGDYSSGAAAFANETWQTGVRMLVRLGGGDAPPSVGSLPTTLAPSAYVASLDETYWTVSTNWTIAATGFDEFNPAAWLNLVAGPAFKTWMQASDCFSNGVRLRNLRLYPIGSTGKAVPAPPYAAGSPALLTYKSTYPTGAVSTTLLPPQLTAAASLRTAQVGRRGRGRMFGPALGSGAVSAGVLASTPKAALLSAYQTLLESLSVPEDPSGDTWLRPSVIGAPWDSYAIINTVMMDDIIDTQRRRRRAALSTWSSAAVVY